MKTEIVNEYSRITPPDNCSKEGYNLDYWYIIDGSVHRIWNFDSYFYRVYEDLNLYAQLSANIYTITFVDDDLNTTNDSMAVVYDESFTLPKPTVAGYSFLNWVDETGKIFTDGIWNIASDLTLYAKWMN